MRFTEYMNRETVMKPKLKNFKSSSIFFIKATNLQVINNAFTTCTQVRQREESN